MTSAENDDGRPERDEPSDWVRDLPPEWGRIVIPDDPAALAAEAEAVRRELRARRSRRPGDPRPALGHRRGAGRPRGTDSGRGASSSHPTTGPGQPPGIDSAGPGLASGSPGEGAPERSGGPDRQEDGPWPTDVPGPLRYAPTTAVPRLPLLVLAIAVLATLASFLAAMWPGQSRPSPGQVRETAGRWPLPADPVGRTVPAIDLVDEAGSTVALRSLLPAVILLTEECACPAAVAAAVAAAPPGVTVVAVASAMPTPGPPLTTPPAGGTIPVRSLADPTGGLRRFLRAPARPGEAAALLIDRTGQIIRFLPAVSSAEDYRADLSRLAPA